MIQFDEPAFNVYMDDVKRWGIDALHRAIEGLKCTTCVHICYGYGIQANLDWKKTLGDVVAPVRGDLPRAREEQDRPGLARVHPLESPGRAAEAAQGQGRARRRDRRRERQGRDAGGGVRRSSRQALKYVPARHLFPCTNCGMAPMDREIALQEAPGARRAGAPRIARKRHRQRQALERGASLAGNRTYRPATHERANTRGPAAMFAGHAVRPMRKVDARPCADVALAQLRRDARLSHAVSHAHRHGPRRTLRGTTPRSTCA